MGAEVTNTVYTSTRVGTPTRGRRRAMRWDMCLATDDTVAAADWPVCCHCLQVTWLNPLSSPLSCCDAFTGERKEAFDHTWNPTQPQSYLRQLFKFLHWGMNKRKYLIWNISKDISLCYRNRDTSKFSFYFNCSCFVLQLFFLKKKLLTMFVKWGALL